MGDCGADGDAGRCTVDHNRGRRVFMVNRHAVADGAGVRRVDIANRSGRRLGGSARSGFTQIAGNQDRVRKPVQ